MRRVLIAGATHNLIFNPEDLAAAKAATPEGETPVIDLTPEVPEPGSVELQPILMDPDRKVELESLLREHHRLMLGGEKLPPPNDLTRRVLAMKCPRCNTKSTAPSQKSGSTRSSPRGSRKSAISTTAASAARR